MISSSTRPHLQRAPFRRLSVSETPWISDELPRDRQLAALLVFDGSAKYVLPFPCRFDASDDSWHHFTLGTVLTVQVIGWHPIESQQTKESA
jgi:hypothetical protein